MNPYQRLARNLVNERLAVPGVQKKLSLNLTPESHEGPSRLTIVGCLGGTHILKPATDEYPYMAEIENLTMHLAEKCNIKVAAHGLIVLKDQSLAYITRRFDRNGKKKSAVEDLCQLSGMTTEQKIKVRRSGSVRLLDNIHPILETMRCDTSNSPCSPFLLATLTCT